LLSGELVYSLASALLAVLRGSPLLILRSLLRATRFLRIFGTRLATRRLRLGLLGTGLSPLVGASCPLLIGLFGTFGSTRFPLFTGFACLLLLLLLPIPGDRLGTLDLLRSSADF
jgi:hypothetical protein